MFGYIKPFKPDLRMGEYDAYKAVYCGLCGQLGQSYGPIARLTLSYDFAFLAMLHWAVGEEDEPVLEPGRCYGNPLKKLSICRAGEPLAHSADIALLMLYYKLLDNMSDGGVSARLGWGLLHPLAKAGWKKAAARRPGSQEIIARSMAEQTALEAAGCTSVDAACQPSAQTMAELLASLSPDPSQQRILERIGYLVGRYVYLCDALDDLEADLKSGSYNPLVQRYQLSAQSGLEALQEAYRYGRDAIYLTAGEAAKAYQLLEVARFGSILDNVFYQGLRTGADGILLRRMPGWKRPEEGAEPEARCSGCPMTEEATRATPS